MNCKKAPKGWRCTRDEDHDGPCAAVKLPGFWARFGNALGEAIGEVMFGGGR